MDRWILALGLLASLGFALEAAALLRAAGRRTRPAAAEARSGRPLRLREDRRRRRRRRSDRPA